MPLSIELTTLKRATRANIVSHLSMVNIVSYARVTACVCRLRKFIERSLVITAFYWEMRLDVLIFTARHYGIAICVCLSVHSSLLVYCQNVKNTAKQKTPIITVALQ